jgi:hypothetical protein
MFRGCVGPHLSRVGSGQIEEKIGGYGRAGLLVGEEQPYPGCRLHRSHAHYSKTVDRLSKQHVERGHTVQGSTQSMEPFSIG